MVLGFDAVRNIAITVLLFEHLQNKGNANQLKDEFLRANFAGILAKDVGIAPRSAMSSRPSSARCSTTWPHAGAVLLPEEGRDIRRLVEQKGISEDRAAHEVLGISFEEMGVGIAQHWGFRR